MLETQGVPVITLNGTNGNFPAFFSPVSGVPSPYNIESAAQAADVVHATAQLNLKAGTVVAVPNPDPADSEAVEAAVQSTLREAEEQGICGRDVTPFVLQRVNELTGRDSLKSNIALVKNNAATGAAIAVELNGLKGFGEVPVNGLKGFGEVPEIKEEVRNSLELIGIDLIRLPLGKRSIGPLQLFPCVSPCVSMPPHARACHSSELPCSELVSNLFDRPVVLLTSRPRVSLVHRSV